MKTIKCLVVLHEPARQKWPETADKDFSKELLRPIYVGCRRINGELIRLITHAFPIYSCYEANCWQFPKQLANPGDINNTYEPDPRIADALVTRLSTLADQYDVISWVHATHCFPEVAASVLPKYKLSVLHFGDDCPGSSENKSFPSVKHFDAVIHRMLVWNYDTGETVPDKYYEHGFRGGCYHNVGGDTSGIREWLIETNFDLEEKLARPELPIDFVWIGSKSMGVARSALLTRLNATCHEADFSSRLHGWRMRDGIIGAEPTSCYPGWDAASLYNDSALGLNYPVSSYFNSRLFDLPMLGVAPVMYDPHSELATVGLEPWKHYIPYDGTAAGLCNTVTDMLQRPKMRKSVVKAAHTAMHELKETRGAVPSFNRTLAEHMDRF